MTSRIELKACGIYMIFCSVSSKRYIGSAKKILRRWNSHKSLLRRNRHKNIHLQSAYNKYGAESFSITVLETCSEENLLSREIFWIEKYQTKNNTYGYKKPPFIFMHDR